MLRDYQLIHLEFVDSNGLSYSKATYTLEKADEQKQNEFRDHTFPALKKLIFEEIDHLLFQDECMLRDYQAVQYTWFLRGKQRKIPTYGQHAGVKLIGVLHYETGHVFTTEEE